MALQDLLGGPTKRDIIEAKMEILEILEEKAKHLEDNQAKLMLKIDALFEKIANLEGKATAMAANAAKPAPLQSEDYPALDIDTPAVPKRPAPSAAFALPKPFFANLEGPALLPVKEDYKDNAKLLVTPTGKDTANVEFNTLCVPNFIGSDPRGFMKAFDCDIQNKNVQNIVPLSTTTAHFKNGAWFIDGRISLKFI